MDQNRISRECGQRLRPGLLVTVRAGTTWVAFMNAGMLFEENDVREIGGRLRSLIAAGSPRILIDMEGVEFATSPLLSDLVWLHRRVFEARGVLRFYGLTPAFRTALRSCGLDRVFELYGFVTEALAAGDRPTSLLRPAQEMTGTAGGVSPWPSPETVRPAPPRGPA